MTVDDLKKTEAALKAQNDAQRRERVVAFRRNLMSSVSPLAIAAAIDNPWIGVRG